MSDLSSQSVSHITHRETPIVAHRIFRCLECEQYVVFSSNLPDVASAYYNMQTLGMPSFETINKSELSQPCFPYDFNSLLSSSSDFSNHIPPVVSSSNFQNSLSFFSTDGSHIPFPQVTDLSMSIPVFDSDDTSNYRSRMETDQSNEVALLRSEVEQLKVVVQTLQPSPLDDNIPNSSVRSLTQYSENMETMACTGTLRDKVFTMSAQLEKATCESYSLENRLRGIEDYLPSLVSWAVETTQALGRLQESYKTKKSNKRLTKAG